MEIEDRVSVKNSDSNDAVAFRAGGWNEGTAGFGRRVGCAVSVFAAAVFLTAVPASAEVTGIRIVKDEAISVGKTPVRHVAGVVSGRAERNEPSIPTLDKVIGLKYESDFELWLPVAGGNGRFWFGVLNRGQGGDRLRDDVLCRGGAYGWCAWQAKHVAPSRAHLRLTGFDGPMPQAYGLVVVRDFITFLRHAPQGGAAPNPAAGKIQFAFAYGASQSGRFMRTFLLHGLNTAPSGKVFDGLMPNGARAGYVDLFRPDSDPGSGGKFSAETVYAPHCWSDLMARSGSDAKVFALNAEGEYFKMMAYLTHRGPVPDNVRVFDFPLGGHVGGGPVPWGVCVQPLSIALEDWVVRGTKPPDSRMLVLERRESPGADHLPSEPAELPVTDELGIARGGVRLPPVETPLARYVFDGGKTSRAVPLEKPELARRYGTPEKYRRKVSEVVDRLVRDRFLPESARAKYLADAEKVAW
jgi:hypothetical protein